MRHWKLRSFFSCYIDTRIQTNWISCNMLRWQNIFPKTELFHQIGHVTRGKLSLQKVPASWLQNKSPSAGQSTSFPWKRGKRSWKRGRGLIFKASGDSGVFSRRNNLEAPPCGLFACTKRARVFKLFIYDENFPLVIKFFIPMTSTCNFELKLSGEKLDSDFCNALFGFRWLYFVECQCFSWFWFQLERAADGFSVVAEYYGRGVFNKVCLSKHL